MTGREMNYRVKLLFSSPRAQQVKRGSLPPSLVKKARQKIIGDQNEGRGEKLYTESIFLSFFERGGGEETVELN